MNIDPATLDASKVAVYAAKAHETSLVGFLMAMIPETILSAMVQDNILQVLFVSILFGVSLAMVGDRVQGVLDLLNQVSVVVFKLVALLMKAAPIGAFGAMAFTIGAYGVGTLANLALLVGTFYLTSLLFVFGVLGIVARLCGFSIVRLVGYLKTELLLVLGTSSSESALPALIEKMERAGCPKTIVGLVVPTAVARGRDAVVQGRRGRDRRRLHHPCGDPFDRALGAGRRHGADPGCRPLHERVPQPHELHRQCGCDRGHHPVGWRPRPRALRCGSSRRDASGG
jgi:aerobic C4-dicarboxylate transport protein